MKKIDNAECMEVFNTAVDRLESIKENVYNYYKEAAVLSGTNSYYGGSADAFKEYLKMGELNFINSILNICEDYKNEFSTLAETMYAFEADLSGKIAQELVDEIEGKIAHRGREFEQIVDDIQWVNARASSYISTTSVDTHSVIQSFRDTRKYLDDVQEKMETYDSSMLDRMETLNERLTTFKALVTSASGKDFRENKVVLSGAGMTVNLSESRVVLDYMIQEDPFSFDAEHRADSEKQVAGGWTKDVYGYAGYRLNGETYKHQLKNGVSEMQFEGSLLQGDMYGQFTDYMRGEAKAEILYLGLQTKYGWTDAYKGINAKGEIGVGKIDGKASIGPKDADLLYAKGEAKVLSADGYIIAEYEDEDNFQFGLRGDASAASAEGSIGTELFGITEEDSKTKEKESLLAIKVGGRAGVEAYAEAYCGRKEVWENENISVHSNTLILGGAFGVGVDITITFPSIRIKSFW